MAIAFRDAGGGAGHHGQFARLGVAGQLRAVEQPLPDVAARRFFAQHHHGFWQAPGCGQPQVQGCDGQIGERFQCIQQARGAAHDLDPVIDLGGGLVDGVERIRVGDVDRHAVDLQVVDLLATRLVGRALRTALNHRNAGGRLQHVVQVPHGLIIHALARAWRCSSPARRRCHWSPRAANCRTP
ncbi:hypothetical protein G6F40_014974 [Rhizopus arrhizus]|nr:hypothetical protein G6F40_014974 [Rhizopus arrhizus]